jgi:uncharacterized membrane protein
MSNQTPVPSPSTGKNTTMAAIAYIIFFVPLLTDAKDDPFVKFHVKQGLLLVILGFALSIVNTILYRIPLVGWLVALALGIGLFALWVIGIMNALNGKQEPVPLVGQYAEQYLKF